MTFDEKARFLVKLFVGGFVLIVGGIYAEKAYYRIYPATEEHREELLQTASGSLRCAKEKLSVRALAPRSAEVCGCGQAIVFGWYKKNRNAPLQWLPARDQ